MKNSTRRIPAPHQIVARFLRRKQKRNPAYSLRAFARDTGLSPSFVSLILHDKRAIPLKRLRRITEVLELDFAAQGLLVESLAQRALRNTLGEIAPATSVEPTTGSASWKYLEVGSNHPLFSTIHDHWHTIAILDLAVCENFRPDPKWIARALSITTEEANISLNLLRTVGLLVEENGRLRKADRKIRVPTARSVSRLRRFHRQMIVKALHALTHQTSQADFDRRLINCVTIPANPAKLEQARQRLFEAMCEISDILAEGPCTSVFQLNAQLFPLTLADTEEAA